MMMLVKFENESRFRKLWHQKKCCPRHQFQIGDADCYIVGDADNLQLSNRHSVIVCIFCHTPALKCRITALLYTKKYVITNDN